MKEEICLAGQLPAPIQERQSLIRQRYEDQLLSTSGPIRWPSAFFKYQVDGIKALVEHDALLLADDMGLGKTIQVIAALRILALRGFLESCLLLAPVGLLSHWRREFRAWAPELRLCTVRGPATERALLWSAPAQMFLTNYETFRSDFTANPHSPPRRRTWSVVVLDEGQKIKNRDTQLSRKCKQIRRHRAWVLTGTPLENKEDDLASILEFTAPLADGASPRLLGPGPRLRDLHWNLQLRRKKADVLPQLPPKIVSRIPLSLEGPQLISYAQAETQGILRLSERGDSVRIEHVLELIMRLKQICNFCPATGRSAKLDDLRERIATLVSEGHRALVFSQFTDNRHGVGAIASALRSWNPLTYTGALSLRERNRCITEFREDKRRKVLVLSLRAGGLGLNLQDASYVFHFDRWWNPAVEHQAEDRSHRIGQRFPVHVYNYSIEGTIEERIDEILQQKQLLFDELVDGVSLDLKSVMTRRELFSLFGLSPPGES